MIRKIEIPDRPDEIRRDIFRYVNENLFINEYAIRALTISSQKKFFSKIRNAINNLIGKDIDINADIDRDKYSKLISMMHMYHMDDIKKQIQNNGAYRGPLDAKIIHDILKEYEKYIEIYQVFERDVINIPIQRGDAFVYLFGKMCNIENIITNTDMNTKKIVDEIYRNNRDKYNMLFNDTVKDSAKKQSNLENILRILVHNSNLI